MKSHEETDSVFEDAAELSEYMEENPSFSQNPITMVIQTTQTRLNFEECECCNVVIALGYSDIPVREKVRKTLEDIVEWH